MCVCVYVCVWYTYMYMYVCIAYKHCIEVHCRYLSGPNHRQLFGLYILGSVSQHFKGPQLQAFTGDSVSTPSCCLGLLILGVLNFISRDHSHKILTEDSVSTVSCS